MGVDLSALAWSMSFCCRMRGGRGGRLSLQVEVRALRAFLAVWGHDVHAPD